MSCYPSTLGDARGRFFPGKISRYACIENKIKKISILKFPTEEPRKITVYCEVKIVLTLETKQGFLAQIV